MCAFVVVFVASVYYVLFVFVLCSLCVCLCLVESVSWRFFVLQCAYFRGAWVSMMQAFFVLQLAHFLSASVSVMQETVPLTESLEVHQMLSACLEETILRNMNYIAGDSEFQDRNR